MKSPAFLLLGLTAVSIASELPNPATPPKGVSASDWSGIRAAYNASRHAIQRETDGTLTARNPGQQWNTEFDGKGFTVTPDHGQWTWGLELIGYGERTLSSASSSITHDGGKLICPRDENLTEWFINDTRGLEQGWTIQSRERSTGVPPVSSNLTLTLAFRGNLSPQVSTDGSSVSFHTDSSTTALTYGGLKAWDADGKNLTVRFEQADEDAIRVAVDEKGARYPITIDPIAQQAYLKASNAEMNDSFGTSVALSGDTAVVGANTEWSSATGVNGNQLDNSAGGSGAAYVFVRNGTTWTQQAYLKASNTGGGDQFGSAVAIAGDTVVIGAPYEASNATGVNGVQTNNSAYQAGAAYIFVRNATTWTQQAYLKASNTGDVDLFGSAVAVTGTTVLIGANGEDSNATGANGGQLDNSASQAGAAYVFIRNGATWTQQAYLKASNTAANDTFGRSVTLSNDTAIVGATGEDSNAVGVNGAQSDDSSFNAGAAYVFTRNGTAWTQQAYLKADNTGANDSFGAAMFASDDTVVVGAPGEDSNATGVNGNGTNNSSSGAGAAYVFERNGGAWTQQAYLKASNSGAGDLFGYAVSASTNTVIVGAYKEDSDATGINGNQTDENASDSGAAYIFSRTGIVWTQRGYLKASNTGVSDGFGLSVAVSGDAAMVGAYSEDSNATGVNGNGANNSAIGSGAAYTFEASALQSAPDIAMGWFAQPFDFVAGGDVNIGDAFVNGGFGVAIEIRNDGTADLTGIEISIEGLDASEFQIAEPPNVVESPAVSLVSGARTTFQVNYLPTQIGVKSASIRIVSNDPDENPFVLRILASCNGRGEIDCVDANGTPLRNGSVFPLGSAVVGETVQRTITVRNTGSYPLTDPYTLGNLPITFSNDSGMFQVSPDPFPPLQVGESRLVTLSFTPLTSGNYLRNFFLGSNDEDEPSIVLRLSGTGTTAREAFDLNTGASGLTGINTAPSAIPFNDGVENLLKYAFNMNLAGPDSRTLIPGSGNSGLPSVGLTGTGPATVIRVEFLRRKSSGLVYTPKRSSTLEPGSFVPIGGTPVVTSINDDWERVVVQESADPATLPASFAVVEVVLPSP